MKITKDDDEIGGGQMKKKLDPKWVSKMVDFMIGPQMIVMMMAEPNAAKELTTIIGKAVVALYQDKDWSDSNAWVVASCDRVWQLYNTYMTAKLIKTFDDGVPEPPKIILAKGNGAIN